MHSRMLPEGCRELFQTLWLFFAKKGGIFTVGSVFVVRLCVRLEFGGDFHGWL